MTYIPHYDGAISVTHTSGIRSIIMHYDRTQNFKKVKYHSTNEVKNETDTINLSIGYAIADYFEGIQRNKGSRDWPCWPTFLPKNEGDHVEDQEDLDVGGEDVGEGDEEEGTM